MHLQVVKTKKLLLILASLLSKNVDRINKDDLKGKKYKNKILNDNKAQ